MAAPAPGGEFALEDPCTGDVWGAALRCLDALRNRTDATVELGGWTHAPCAALLATLWAAMSATNADRTAHLLCAAVLVGPLTRVALCEGGGHCFPWYWQSLHHTPATALFDDRDGAIGFVCAFGGLDRRRSAGVVAIALEAILCGRRAVMSGSAPAGAAVPSPHPAAFQADVRLLWECIKTVDSRFGLLRALRWCTSTKTPFRAWSQLDSPLGSKGSSLRVGEPLSLVSIAPWFEWLAQHRLVDEAHSAAVRSCLVAVCLRIDPPATAGANAALVRRLTEAVTTGAQAAWARLAEALPPGPRAAVGPFPGEWAWTS